MAVCNELDAGFQRRLGGEHHDHGHRARRWERLSRELVGQMVAAIERGAAETSGQTFLPLDIFTPENI